MPACADINADEAFPDREIIIVYDGQCPFCSSYVKLTRLKKQFDNVELIDARQDSPIVAQLTEAGYDLNEGMVLLENGSVFFGADAMHRLALMTTPSDLFNRITALVMSNEKLAPLAYPVLKLFRRLTLFVLGRPAL